MKSKIYAIVSIIILVVAVVGATVALVYYRSEVTDVNIKTDPELGTFINYESGDNIIGDDGKTLEVGNHYTSGLSTEIELWKIEEARNMDIYGNIYLDIKNGSEELLNMPALKWAVTSNDILISEGNFIGSTEGESIPILINHKLLTTLTKFKVYVWIDDSEEKNAAAEGETLNVSVWCKATSDEMLLFEVALSSNVLEFDYTGRIENINLPEGSYMIEVWGAQGGNATSDYIGGNGSYSTGKITFDEPTDVFVAVGEQGGSSEARASGIGGFNGGGTTSYSSSTLDLNYSGGGGGATHIALSDGILSSFSDSIDDILIVAGGGGGACYQNYSNGQNYGYFNGGHAGGYIGSSGQGVSCYNGFTCDVLPGGGSQISGGLGVSAWNASTQSNQYMGSFGAGANGANSVGSGGGGSGFYGGGSGGFHPGGGGSGYIGNPLLTEKVMYCYDCKDSSEEEDETNIKTISTTNVSETPISNYAKKGNGHARITEMKNISRKEIVYGTDYNFKTMLNNELGENLTVIYSSFENANELSLGEYQIRYIAVDDNNNKYNYYQKIEIVG